MLPAIDENGPKPMSDLRPASYHQASFHRASFPHASLDYEEDPPEVNRWQRFLDSFKRDPHTHVSKPGQIGVDGKLFDPEGAAANTASSPLQRKLHGRHLQMIAIGGSIGMRLPVRGTNNMLFFLKCS